MAPDLLAWSVAWEQAAFGTDGFYRRHDPRQHFATDVTDGSAVAERLAGIVGPQLARLIEASPRPTVTDVGAADGLLLRELARQLGAPWATHVRWRAVDLRPRPAGLPGWIDWVEADVRDVGAWAHRGPGVVIAHELLDDVPCDVLEIDDDAQRRLVLVEPATGRQVLGPSTLDLVACAEHGVDGAALDAWCDRWWPRREPAARVEVGRPRDTLWRLIADSVSDGLAVGIDYGHVRGERDGGLWDGGTLSAFRSGRACSLTADGSANLTAHVAMDSCAATSPSSPCRLERSPEGLWWLVEQMGR